jgi:hypothetical protein
MQLITPGELASSCTDTPPHSPPRSPLRLALAAATGALLAAGPGWAQTSTPAPGSGPVTWQADASVLSYSESSGRVKAIEPVVSLKRSDANDRVTSLRLTLDTLTGASPTGAVPQPGVQTVTSASGKTSTTTRSGQVPMDSGFKDLRGAANLSHEQPFGEGRRISLGLNLSGETDFYSLGANVGLSQDFNNKNTTASIGLAYEFDLIKPVGFTPRPLLPHLSADSEGGSKTRNVGDLLLGVTQVMNRRWLMQFNVGVGSGSGYQNDPYKVVSVVSGSGLETGDLKVSEARPGQRRRVSLYWQNKVHLGEDVVDLALRHYHDSWGIRAETADLHYRYELNRGWYLEPQLRVYRQNAADFYRPYLLEGSDYNSATHVAAMSYASADPRLAAFTARTVGMKLGFDLGKGREFGVRLASYQQKMSPTSSAPGYLATVPLTDPLKAMLLQIGISQQF